MLNKRNMVAWGIAGAAVVSLNESIQIPSHTHTVTGGGLGMQVLYNFRPWEGRPREKAVVFSADDVDDINSQIKKRFPGAPLPTPVKKE